ncbi:MAG: hypothetical protein ACRDJ4_05035 [Actinomycetota bacterium]
MLEGHGHFAFQTDPAMVAALIREFSSSWMPPVSPGWLLRSVG